MVIRNVELEIVCGVTSSVPDTELPEIAFAGKSNVGKSSLINALMNRKALARTSAQPGKTQTINFYNVNKFMYLVDLPGYGFTKAPKSERERWGKMVENYLHVSKQLKAVFLLVDIRHKPAVNDKTMYDWIVYQGFRPIIVATKLDKLKRSQVDACVEDVREGLGMQSSDILIPFSAETKQGREEIWEMMDRLTGWEEPEKGLKKEAVPDRMTGQRSDVEPGRKSGRVPGLEAEKEPERGQSDESTEPGAETGQPGKSAGLEARTGQPGESAGIGAETEQPGKNTGSGAGTGQQGKGMGLSEGAGKDPQKGPRKERKKNSEKKQQKPRKKESKKVIAKRLKKQKMDQKKDRKKV